MLHPAQGKLALVLAALCCLLQLDILLGSSPAAGHGGAPERIEGDRVALDRRPGARLPLDAVFRDDSGAAVRLGELTGRPLLLTFVYFGCSRRCPLVLGGLAESLGRLPLRAGEDYAVATISIDDGDTPAAAAAAKRNYLAVVGSQFPVPAWRFLVGDREAIRRVTEAVGLHYQRQGEHFFHPATVVVVTPEGTVAGYLPIDADRNDVRARIAFQPAQLQVALADAGRGVADAAGSQPVLYCSPFERDPERSFYRTLRVFGVINLLGVALLAIFLAFGKSGGAGRNGA